MKKIKKIILLLLVIFGIILLLLTAAAGITYHQIKKSGKQVELLSEPVLVPERDSVRMGEKYVLIGQFRLPWGIHFSALSANAAPGTQLTALPYYKLGKYRWGYSIWNGMIPMQAFREGKMAAATGQAVFSNGQEIALKLPEVTVTAPEVNGSQLELAGKLESQKKSVFSNRKYWLWGLAITAVLLLLILGIVLWIRGKAPKALTFWERALNSIHDLLERVRIGNIAPEKSIALLTDIVREYMEHRFHLRAGRQTTAEFLADLNNGKGNLTEDQREFLQNFLNAADLVKFAKVPADQTLLENAASHAEQLIRQTIPESSGKER